VASDSTGLEAWQIRAYGPSVMQKSLRARL
jgi:hypothetical protein